MTETQNVATYARIRPYNPAINEDKRLTARALTDDERIMLKDSGREYLYNFTKVFDMKNSNEDLFEDSMKPLLDFKILQGINSIFMVYGQSGSGKSYTLIGEPGHYGILAMSLRYLLNKDDIVSKIDMASIEAYGVNAAKIGFYDLVHHLSMKKETLNNKKGKKGKKNKKNKKNKIQSFDPFSCKHNAVLSHKNAKFMQVTKDNCLNVIMSLQAVSHMAPTLKNPHSSRGHTVYFCRITMKQMEDVYFIACDLAGSEGQTALGTQHEFVSGLKLAMKKGKLRLDKTGTKIYEKMYKMRSLEAGCINNGLTSLQTMFGELIRRKISKSRGLGLRKVISKFITLKSAYVVLFTMSASANNTKITKATLNFAKQTQLVRVETQKAKPKVNKDAVIKELNILIEQLKTEMTQKDEIIANLQDKKDDNDNDNNSNNNLGVSDILHKMNSLTAILEDAEKEESRWSVSIDDIQTNNMDENELKTIFAELDIDNSGSIDANELHDALHKMGRNIDMDQVYKMVQDVDANGDGEIDFDEFKVMIAQKWFIDAFQSKLAKKVETFITNTMHAHCDSDIDIDIIDEQKYEQKYEYENELYALRLENKKLKADLIALRNKFGVEDEKNDTLRLHDDISDHDMKIMTPVLNESISSPTTEDKLKIKLKLKKLRDNKNKSNTFKYTNKAKQRHRRNSSYFEIPINAKTNLDKLIFIYPRLCEIKTSADRRMKLMINCTEILSDTNGMNKQSIKYAINGFKSVYMEQMKDKNINIKNKLYNILCLIISNYTKYFQSSAMYFLKYLIRNIGDNKSSDAIMKCIQQMIEKYATTNDNQLIIMLNEFMLKATTSKFKNIKLKGWNLVYIALKTKLENSNNIISKDVIVSIEKGLKIGLCSNDKHIQSHVFSILHLLFNSKDNFNMLHNIYVNKLYQKMSVSAQKTYQKKYKDDIIINQNKAKNTVKKLKKKKDDKKQNNTKHRKYKPKKKHTNEKSKIKTKAKEKEDIKNKIDESDELKNDNHQKDVKHRKYKPTYKKKKHKNKHINKNKKEQNQAIESTIANW